MGKFRVSKATLHRTKRLALSQAKKLRNQGWRAEVQRASKHTTKRSPYLKWVCFRGQKKQGRYYCPHCSSRLAHLKGSRFICNKCDAIHYPHGR